jgi:DNA processing protein
VTGAPSDTAAAAISDDERLARLRLALSDNVGPATWHQLIDRYGSGEAALAHLPELAQRAGAGRRIRLFTEADAKAIMEKTARLGGCILMPGDPHYPDLLIQTGQAPPLLFVLGRTSILLQSCCGIVGSRNASANGKRFARETAMALGRAGHAVVSGLARGIDTAAHQASVETGTIAVMATGLDVIYPDENAGLAEQIAQTGCIVTEMPPGTRPRAELFRGETASSRGWPPLWWSSRLRSAQAHSLPRGWPTSWAAMSMPCRARPMTHDLPAPTG